MQAPHFPLFFFYYFLICNAPFFSLECQIMMHNVLGFPPFTGSPNICLYKIPNATQTSPASTWASQTLFKGWKKGKGICFSHENLSHI